MHLRSTLTKLTRITHSNVVRTCTNQITSKPPQSTQSNELPQSSTDWRTIYEFPSIKFIVNLSKLKNFQSAFTAAGVPLLMGLQSMEMVSVDTTTLFAAIGITGTISLSIYSLCAKNVIGFVYVNPVLKKIRFAYVDFWGKRQNLDVKINELVSAEQRTVFNTCTLVKTTTDVGSLKLLKHGTVLDSDMFVRIFGYI